MTQKIKLQNSKIAWVPIVFTVLLILARDISGVPVNKFIFVGLAAVSFVMVDKHKIYEFIAFLIPLFAGLPGNYIACLALFFVLFKSGGKLFQDAFGLGCCIIILIIEFFSIFRGYDFNIVDYVTFAGAFLLTFMFIFDKDADYNYWKISWNFVLGLLVAIADIIGQMLNHYSWTQFLSLGVRIGDIGEILNEEIDAMTLSYNCNSLGMFCATSILVCLLSFTRYKKKWVLPVGIALLPIGIMTQSRAFIIVLFLGLIMYFITGNDKPSTIAKKIVILIVGFSLGIYLVMKYIPDYFESFMMRFQVEDISNNRIDITSQYWERFINSFDKIPFGSGLQNYNEKYGMKYSAHMGFEEVLITWGIFGLSLLLAVLFRIVKILNIKKFSEYERLVPFATYIIALQSGQLFSNTTAFMSFIAWFAFAKISAESIINDNEIIIASGE